MKTLKRIAILSLAVVAAASPALAGTKYSANTVPFTTVDPPQNPTLSPKGSIKLDDKGGIVIALAGVTDAAGALVTTSTAFNESVKAGVGYNLDGSEYIAIIKLYIPAISGIFPVVEVPVPVDLKAGKGKTKLSAAAAFALIPDGFGRVVEIIGTEIWGQLDLTNGQDAQDCEDVINGSPPVGLPLAPGVCRGGDHIGMSGLAIPVPAP